MSIFTPKESFRDFLISSVFTYSEELQQLKKNLACLEHPGENVWCWVDSQQPDANHIPLVLNDIQLWAQHMVRTLLPRFLALFLMFEQYTHPTDASFTALPNTAYFDELCETRTPRTTLSPIPTEPNTPEILDPDHVSGTSSTVANPYANIPTTANAPGGHGITRQYALFLDFDEESDGDECELTVQRLLEFLHVKYPVLNYLRFQESLQALGINYLATAAILDASFFMRKVGMSRETAHIFCDAVITEIRRGADQMRVKRRGLSVV